MHKLIVESKHTCPTEQRMLLMSAELPTSSYVGLVLNFVLLIWGDPSSALSPPSHLTSHSQETHSRQKIINQKGRKYTFCILADKGRKLLLQLFVTAVSWTSAHPLPGVQTWAIPSAPAHPLGPSPTASTKPGPSPTGKLTSRH